MHPILEYFFFLPGSPGCHNHIIILNYITNDYPQRFFSGKQQAIFSLQFVKVTPPSAGRRYFPDIESTSFGAALWRHLLARDSNWKTLTLSISLQALARGRGKQD